MGVFGRTIEIKGQVFSNEDLTIEGRIDGSLTCEGAAVIVMEAASVNGDIIARDLTVLGRVDGQMIATDVVHVRSGAVVTGQVMAKNFILNDGGNFVGRVEPQHLEAALRVAKFQQRRKDSA
jgi:cytoskeletal protein CcmA (bactofilin family)